MQRTSCCKGSERVGAPRKGRAIEMAPPKRESVVPKPVLALYNVMQSVEARLGGGEGVQGIYGSITASGVGAPSIANV